MPLKAISRMGTRRMDYGKFVLDRFIWFVVVLVFVFFSLFAPNFLTSTNMINILLHASVLGLMVLGQG